MIRQLTNLELNLHLVLHFDRSASHAYRLDSEIRLLDARAPDVSVSTSFRIETYRFRDSMQRQLAFYSPLALACFCDVRGAKSDLRILAAFERHLLHVLLN